MCLNISSETTLQENVIQTKQEHIIIYSTTEADKYHSQACAGPQTEATEVHY